MDKNCKKSAVILDVDGVLNSFSNRKFYLQFAYKSLRYLSKVHGKTKLLKELPKIKKMGGPNALFVFAKEFCGNEKNFNKFKHDLINNLNFNLVSHDKTMKEMMKRLCNFGDVCIRTDGLEEIGAAIWKRVIDDVPSEKIKLDIMNDKSEKKYKQLSFDNKKITISGITDNEFKLKTNPQSWKNFAQKHDIDISNSVLLDDSRDNTNIAKSLGMTTVHISILDSFLQKSSIGTVFGHSLSDILGKKMSSTLKTFKISYGNKVNLKNLFNAILNKNNKNEISNNAFYNKQNQK